VRAEGISGLQELVDEGRLAVVDMRDDCDVSDLLLQH